MKRFHRGGSVEGQRTEIYSISGRSQKNIYWVHANVAKELKMSISKGSQ